MTVTIRYGRMLLAILSVATGACRGSSLWNVSNPVDQVTESILNSPTGAQQVFLGAEWQLTNALYANIGGDDGAVILLSELLSDEYMEQYTQAYEPIDARYTSAEEPGITEENGDAPLVPLLAARATLLLAAPSLTTYEVGANRALAGEALALAGFAELFLAEDYCAGVPLDLALPGGGIQFGAPLTTDSLLGAAEAHFQQALLASDSDTTVTYLASVGLGRALVDRGQFDAAAAAVAQVPTGFVYSLSGQSSNGSFGAVQPLYWNMGYCSSCWWPAPLVANDKGNTAYNFATANDGRLALAPLGYTVDGGENTEFPGLHLPDSTFYWPLKFGTTPNAFTTFPLATGVEARLIGIEDLLADNPGAVVPALDSLRAVAPTTYVQAAAGVPALSGDSTSCGGPKDLACVNVLFRERAFWLFGLGERLGDMRREIRQYGMDTSAVYPTGPYWYDPTDSAVLANANGGYSQQPQWTYYGKDVSLTLPTAAAANFGFNTSNPNLKGGCLAPATTETP